MLAALLVLCVAASHATAFSDYTCDTTSAEREQLGAQLVANMQAKGYVLNTVGTFYFLSNQTGGSACICP